MTRRGVFGSMLGLVFLANLARVIYAPLIEPLMAAYVIGAGAAGLIATLAWLGSAIARIPVGYLLTRVSRARVILASGGLLVAGAAAAAVAPTVGVLGAAALLMGIATGMYFIAANALASELYPRTVGRAIGTHYTAAQTAAVIAGPLVTLVLAVGDFRLAFLGMAGAAVLATAAFYRAARRTDLPGAGAEDRDLLGAARSQWPLILTGAAILGTGGFVWNGTFNFYVTYLKTTGMAEPTARNVLTVVFAAGLPAIWGSGRLADRLPHVPLLLGVLGGFAAVLLALAVGGGVAVLVVLSALLGLAVHALFPAVDAYVLDSLPDGDRASAYSVYSGATILLMSAGSSAVGLLTEAGVSFPALFTGFAGLLLAVVAVLGALYALDALP